MDDQCCVKVRSVFPGTNRNCAAISCASCKGTPSAISASANDDCVCDGCTNEKDKENESRNVKLHARMRFTVDKVCYFTCLAEFILNDVFRRPVSESQSASQRY